MIFLYFCCILLARNKSQVPFSLNRRGLHRGVNAKKWGSQAGGILESAHHNSQTKVSQNFTLWLNSRGPDNMNKSCSETREGTLLKQMKNYLHDVAQISFTSLDLFSYV